MKNIEDLMNRLQYKQQELSQIAQQINQEYGAKKEELAELETNFIKVTGQMELVEELIAGIPDEHESVEPSVEEPQPQYPR